MYYFQLNKIFQNGSEKSVVLQNDDPAKYSGQTNYKNAKKHTVEPGDSLWKISQKYKGVSVNQLRNINNLKSDVLKPGQQLIISTNQ